jgi:hypothetical protein
VKLQTAGVLLSAAWAASACSNTTLKDIEPPMVAAQAGKPTIGTGLWPCSSFPTPPNGVPHMFSVSGRSFELTVWPSEQRYAVKDIESSTCGFSTTAPEGKLEFPVRARTDAPELLLVKMKVLFAETNQSGDYHAPGDMSVVYCWGSTCPIGDFTWGSLGHGYIPRSVGPSST